MNPRHLQKLTLCAALALAPAVTLSAQTAVSPAPTPATATTPAAEEVTMDETLVLSPFTVSTKKDVGYLAGNTLAGSRLNTKLKDTGAAISVFTPEFIKDIGATNMKDLILFENNAVPDVGDAALSVNGNPMIGNDEWQLRIRGLAASYSRNFFKWEASSDFYNVDRVDQTRGPNSILFGFGAPGGLVNTSTKQALLDVNKNELSYTVGSWNRNRGTFDTNISLVPGSLAVRVNGMAESANSWRDFEFDRSRRAHLATKWSISKETSLRVEGEYGRIKDNVARPWLAIDQSFLWRKANRPAVDVASAANNWTAPYGAAYIWDRHMVVANDGVVRDWQNHAYGSNTGNRNGDYIDVGATDSWEAPTWSAWADTKANNKIIPRTSNTGGPDATRETKYKTLSAFFESKLTDSLSYELALNHQAIDFLGYDPDGSRATTYYGNSTEIYGDASSDLPDVWAGSAGVNSNAGKLFLENNWTRRNQNIKSTDLRATVAYNFNTGDFAKHRLAGLLGYNQRTFTRLEETEAFHTISGWTINPAKAEADVYRLYRRHYFTPGNSKDIHVQSWRNTVPGTHWVPTQKPEDTKAKQTTGMLAMQSFFLKDKLVTIVGLRSDRMKYDFNVGKNDNDVRDSRGFWFLNPIYNQSTNFNANTLTGGAVFHSTKWLSFFGNVASSRDLPEVRIHVIGSDIPPMSQSKGGDVGIKLDLLEGKLYATIGYYKANSKRMTDWGNVQTDITDRNTKILNALLNPDPTVSADPLITQAEYDSHLINANGFMYDRDTSGWEFSLVANPKTNWRVSANFSINNVIARNSMAEIRKWATENEAFWRSKTPTNNPNLSYNGDGMPTGNIWDASWDNLGNQIGWMEQYAISSVTSLDGHNARGQRKYGGNFYTKYTIESGTLKGFSYGGGGRFQSANVLGMYDDTIDGKYNPTLHYGRNLVLMDMNLGYTFKTEWAGKGSWAEIQLNVANLLDKRDDQIYTLTWWGAALPGSNAVVRLPERVGLQEPRKFTLSATLHF